jgi:hypothetical protein
MQPEQRLRNSIGFLRSHQGCDDAEERAGVARIGRDLATTKLAEPEQRNAALLKELDERDASLYHLSQALKDTEPAPRPAKRKRGTGK